MDNYQRLTDNLRRRFGFDFTAVSVSRENGRGNARAGIDEQFLSWDYVSGNQTDRYRRIYLPAGVGILGQVSASCRPLIVRNSYRDISRSSWYQFPIVAAEGLKSFFAVPLMDGENVRLIVLCAYREARNIDAALLESIGGFLRQESEFPAVTNRPIVMQAQSATPIRAEAAHRFLQAQEDERKRIARELHDGLGQELLLVQIALRSYRYLPENERDQAVQQASDQLKEAIAHVSAIAHDLRPDALDELGLAEAMRAECRTVAQRFGVAVDDAAVEDMAGLNADCEVALYRIFQEAVSNACKYAHSDRLRVALAKRHGEEPCVCLEVQDFGQGFNAEHPKIQGGGLGLVGMRERAATFGGTVAIESAPGSGTIVRATIPLDPTMPSAASDDMAGDL
jgi:two-component system sensor histidine kinase NreB